MTITRRDFLNGAALTVAAGLTPAAQLGAQPNLYPPALTGLRGQHAGSFEIAHALRDGQSFALGNAPIEERYDLVVVGGGISGLSAAWFYRRARPEARILILDNHDDFGGHAKRNEFTIGGRRMIGYGGSQSLQSPNTLYSPVAKKLLTDLGVDLKRFESAFDRNLYSSLGLTRGTFFNRETFGRDVLVAGEPPAANAEENPQRKGNALLEFVAAFPISAESQAQLLSLYSTAKDLMAGKSIKRKKALLKRISYRDYLTKFGGLSEEAANCLQGRTLDFYGLGADAVPAADARDLGYPGFAGLKLPQDTNAAWKEPYIYHFPDGNAGIARLLVRALIPGVARGHTMEDLVEAPFDYAKLDRDGQGIRLRLNSTCVNVRESGGKVQVAYVRDGALRRVEARHAVLACFNMMIPYLMPQLPKPQRAALAKNVKTPICYTDVLIRNWQAFAALKVHSIHLPMGFHSHVSLDFPVSLGGYKNPRDPSEPMLLHLVHIPGAPNRGLDAREQFRIGRGQLYTMTFADFEARIRDELDRMLGAGGFASDSDIAAITVNRWPHGYSYVANSLFDPNDYENRVLKVARQRAGNVAIANTDAGGDAWVHYAIDQANRAVRELTS
ncbi:NAD(P)-binding protein [Rhodoplanes sp. Z2-YC6860]|uniref:NAD(P)-binding protein n=1 Tax=Rhodoplanes sp. Z2-YC6860 TaxID=674703 RepID=UPI00078D4EC7|nr:FAD/NAD(P)-binding protein [Rhodoplanes sp. Z2-YC6860]AMN39903.1 spermidine dehydrogenase [Rhodoplanes sp. Z2-YC6860]